MKREFMQVDVFSAVPTLGNPVAVVLDAVGLSDVAMVAFARWTNLSETTFVLPPTDPATADYRLRIFTPQEELPFAGHPTLGSAHAWSAAGGTPRGGRIRQECGIGIVELRREDDRLAFAAPPLIRSGPVDPPTVTDVAAALGLRAEEILAAEWVVNGPPWLAIRLASAQRVLSLQPDMAALGDRFVGVVGSYAPGESDAEVEVRAFAPGAGVAEDPVTGSLNAGIARWLRSTGVVPNHYVASQGTAIGRAGRVYVADDGADGIWVGGDCVTVIDGAVDL
ncbi:PhzF family phenazine biosynthesis protein [Gordonia sp. ABSL1-1]|uniref:PhzF family phenazine biosynthesis protein n=1 Tax=Gordonia sp. ABSL1-1 TaxID=3053923 RepID=UPI002572998F|nr:PhzF family phenazine biosynthesis protein [Gordonia sp. ABSL1-1]MDL9938219.1 PhzF family phenazine biosynthesis protein [Gordonia sp. ABSL1-1]